MRGLGTLLRALATLRRKARGQVDTGRKRYEVPPIPEGPSSFRVEPNRQNGRSSSSPVGMWAGCL
jgi:hypothetical protein